MKQEVQELLSLGEQADQGETELPEGLVLEDELNLRQERLVNLAEVRKVLEERANERYTAEKAEYETKMKERTKKARKRHYKPKGRLPQAPEPGPRDKDQYNFTDPDSRIMKNSTNDGFDQYYNVQVAADQESMLIVSQILSNYPNDKQEALPTLKAMPSKIGTPNAVAMDNGYFSETNIQDYADLGIEPYIAIGREPHHLDWHTFFQQQPEPPAEHPVPLSRWLTNSKPRSDRPFTVCANAPWNPSSGSSRKSLAFVNSPCAVGWLPQASGVSFA